jgi:hypothetical protein
MVECIIVSNVWWGWMYVGSKNHRKELMRLTSSWLELKLKLKYVTRDADA